MSIFGAAKKGLGMLGRISKKKPTPKPKPKISEHEKFMQKDPYERATIISRRESAKRGDVYTGTSVVGTPSPHRSAKAIKKYSGPGSYQLTDPKRRGPKAAGGRIGLQAGGPPSFDKRRQLKEKLREQYYKKHGRPGDFEKKAREARAKLDTRKTLAVSDPHKRTRHSVYSLRKKGGKV